MSFADRLADKRGQLVHYVVDQLRVDSATAEDIVHDTLAKCLEKQDQFQGGDNEAMLVGWLRTTAYRRGLAKLDPSKQAVEVESIHQSDPGGTPSLEMKYSEARERIHASIAALPDRQREVITWMFFQKWSVKQIAEALGITPDAISGLKARAFAKLTQDLSPDDFQTFLR